MRVSMLQEKNKSHDWLYTERPTRLFGAVRGFSVQLYGTSADLCEELIATTGKNVDRITLALFSFGWLSPYALTFLLINKWRFTERKVTMTRGMKDNKSLYDIGDSTGGGGLDTIQGQERLWHHNQYPGTAEPLDSRVKWGLHLGKEQHQPLFGSACF